MGRGAKIFFVSAVFFSLVFGLIAFAIVTAIGNSRERDRSVSFAVACLDENGALNSAVLVYADRDALVLVEFEPATTLAQRSLASAYAADGLPGLSAFIGELAGVLPQYTAGIRNGEGTEALKARFASGECPFSETEAPEFSADYKDYDLLFDELSGKSATVLLPDGENLNGVFVADREKTAAKLVPYIENNN